MSSILDEKKRRNAALIEKLGYPGASVVSGVSEAALRGPAVPDGTAPVENGNPAAVSETPEAAIPAEVVPSAPSRPAVPASDPVPAAEGVRVQTSHRSEEVPVAERNGVLSFAMGGNAIEIEEGSPGISTEIFAMAMDASMADDFDEILISLGSDKARAAAILMEAGRELLEEMLARKPIAIAVGGIRFRPKTPTAAGRFLASCAGGKPETAR